MTHGSLKGLETHFEFGENWLTYLDTIDEGAVLQAEKGLTKLLPPERIRGSRFLDIGCGSGLHSLAALRLGASDVHAIDIDPKSVEATKRLLDAKASSAQRKVEVRSVFEAKPDDLGTFDIVYSWGVLHHTGAMWEAIERASRFVRPGGLFALALYQKRPSCGFWRWEKRAYSTASPLVQKIMRGGYKGLYFAGLLARGRNPRDYVRDYKTKRGMSFHHDVHDWLGGYPYESATPQEVETRMAAAGFEVVRDFRLKGGFVILGTGCAEYTLRRREAPNGA